MDLFPPLLSDHDIELAKKRVWNRMEARLPDRGLSPFGEVVKVLQGNKVESPRLQQVMLKERLLDQLPDRNRVPFFFNRKLWASMTLSIFVAFFTVPVFSMNAAVEAKAVNLLEVVQGSALVNGVPVERVALLQEGDEVSTGPGSMAHVQLQDDTRLTMGPRTAIQLTAVTDAVVIQQSEGRVWTQVVNPVNENGSVTLAFPGGEVVASQKASFDVQVNEESSQVQVAENLVSVSVAHTQIYEGTVGQGNQLTITDQVEAALLPDDYEDVWWEFNENYGHTYVAALNETYSEARLASVSILPDHPLYFLKAWRETVQETLTFGDDAKQSLVTQHMEMRLNEAQILIEQGKTEEAQVALVAYQEAVERNLELSGAAVVESSLEDAQKELLAKLEMDAGTQLLEAQLTETSTLVAETPTEKNEVRMMSASQKLSRVPGLIEVGDYEQALYYLNAYKAESLSILTELELVPFEEREVLISAILEQKLSDLQMLRMIAAMPDFNEVVDADGQIIQEMSVMVLSLRERDLTRLSDFFSSTEYDVAMQYELYAKLKGETALTPAISQQFEAVETALETPAEVPAAPEVDPEPAVDPRFVD